MLWHGRVRLERSWVTGAWHERPHAARLPLGAESRTDRSFSQEGVEQKGEEGLMLMGTGFFVG